MEFVIGNDVRNAETEDMI